MKDVVTHNETSLISYSRSLVRDLDSAREIVQALRAKPPDQESQLRDQAERSRRERADQRRLLQIEKMLKARSHKEFPRPNLIGGHLDELIMYGFVFDGMDLTWLNGQNRQSQPGHCQTPRDSQHYACWKKPRLLA